MSRRRRPLSVRAAPPPSSVDDLLERRAPQRFTWMDRALLTSLLGVGIWIGVNTTYRQILVQRLEAVEKLAPAVADLSAEQRRTDERFIYIREQLQKLTTVVERLEERGRR